MSAKRFLLPLAALFLASPSWGGEPLMGPEEARRLASDYELGRGVERDFHQAFRFYCVAAIQGDPEADYSLGWMYFNGRGVPHDPDLAAGWFKRAADSGDRQSANMLRLLAGAEPMADLSCLGLGREEKPDRLWVEAWVRSRASEYGLDPDLVLGVISAESGFDPQAESPRGAKGLMQLMPATASRFGVLDIWDPADNLRGGMAYLQWLLRYYRGDVTLTLAAYNAGEGVVDRYAGVPPYPETRQYVERVTRDYPLTTHPVQEHPRIVMADSDAARSRDPSPAERVPKVGWTPEEVFR